MQKNIHFVKWINKKLITSVLLGYFLVITPIVEAYAMNMNTNVNATRQGASGGRSNKDMLRQKTDVTWKDAISYVSALIIFIKKQKGWNIGEYYVPVRRVLANAPLAVFHVIHKDAPESIRKSPRQILGRHPLEMKVYIHTEELRAFDDYKEFDRILKEWAEKEKEAVP